MAVEKNTMLRCAASVGLALTVLAAGCGHRQEVETDAASLSPEIQSNLQMLDHELRRTMLHHHLTGSFAEFAAARPDLQIPPPPTGKKYAIDKRWKVVLVDDSSATK